MSIYGGPDIITDGLVLHLDAANSKSYPGSGTVWTDLSGNGNNGTLINGPSYSSSNKGNIVFDGSNDSVQTGISNLNLIDLSICAWVKFTSITNTPYPSITNKEISNVDRNWYLGVVSTIAFARSVGGIDRAVYSNVVPVLNQWYHITATNNSIPIFSIYINGILNNINILSGTLSTSGTNNWIGTYRDFLYPMRGNISQISLYNRALSANEVSQNYNATKGRYNL